MAEPLLQPVVIGNIQNQAAATRDAAAGMARFARDHRQLLLLDAASAAVHLEIQLPAQAEHQLGVLVAVDDLVVVVMAQ